MVSDTLRRLGDFRLSDSNASFEGYTDITEFLISKAHKLKNNVVIKSPRFSLFDGTHALEVNNPKLDTGIIQLTRDEVEFDYLKGRSLTEVLWISQSLLRSVSVWLNNSSLAVTTFSSIYVEKILVNHTKDPRGGLSSCRFDPNYNIPTDQNSQLVHLVLRSVVLGILGFVNICISLGQAGVVYEEEDINTQNMNLDVLTSIETSLIEAELNKSLKFLQKNFPTDQDSFLLQNVIWIVKKLLDFPSLLTIQIPKSGTTNLDLSLLDDLGQKLGVLQENIEYINKLPPVVGCYSLGIQKRLDNRSQPKPLVSFQSEDFKSLQNFVRDLNHIFLISGRSSTQDVLNFALNFSNRPHHIISRIFLPIFLIRDDRTVLGVESFGQFLIEELVSFSCCETSLTETENTLVQSKLNEFLDQISSAYYDYLTSMNQNPCRQRQHESRLIVTLDSLQAMSENLELELRDVFQIDDEFEETPGSGELTPALPISSWIYYVKLQVMISVVLKGFELDLYKIWEFHNMYAYANYLIGNLFILLERVKTFNLFKIESIKNMGKKLKKKKGDQKQRYKEKYQNKLTHNLPILEASNLSIDGTISKYKVLQDLCNLQLLQLENLLSNDFIKTPEFPFIKDETQLYNLRMKPFSTVGIPTYPTYEIYKKEFVNAATPDIKRASESIKERFNLNVKAIIERIEAHDRSLGYDINPEDWIDWYKSYQKSSIAIRLNFLKPQQTSQEFRVDVESEGYHRYFPIIKLVKK